MAVVSLIRISDPLHLTRSLSEKSKHESFSIYEENGVTWLSALIEAESRRKVNEVKLSEVRARAKELFRIHGNAEKSRLEIWYPIDDELKCLKVETKETVSLVEKEEMPEEISPFIGEV